MAGVSIKLPYKTNHSIRQRAHDLGVGVLPAHLREEKTCTACQSPLPIEAFRVSNRGEGGKKVSPTCLRCEAAHRQTPIERAKRTASTNRWRKANPDAAKAIANRGSVKRREAKAVYWKQWYVENRAHVLEQAKLRSAAQDPEERRQKRREAYAVNPEPARMANNLRRARLAQVPRTLTRKEWVEILAEHKSACFYCQRDDLPITMDHIVPLSKGGWHTKDNVRPACRTCNAKKYVNELPEEDPSGL